MFFLLVSTLFGCGETSSKVDSQSPVDSPTRVDSPTVDDDDSPVDSPSDDVPEDSPEDSPVDSPEDSPVDTAPVEEGPVVHFVALGDAGEGNDEQYAVGAAMETVCARDGCDFALYLGDNFYDSGAEDADDTQFQEKFELPYEGLDFPFYVTLGNHDYGGEGIGWELWKGEIYIDYSDRSDRWTFPDLYYTFAAEEVDFFALDTTQVFWGITDSQLSWLQSGLAASTATWKIVFGHHPYISNGPHGNAGSYEGLDWLPIVNGEAIQDFIEDGVCGSADVYLCGHDHSMQWPESSCGTEFIVSGAGAKTTELEGDNPTWFEHDQPGFVWVEIAGRTFTGVFYDENGTELYRRSITK